MNVAALEHPRHLLTKALSKRAQHEQAHLERLRAAAQLRAERRHVAAESGQEPPAEAGPA